MDFLLDLLDKIFNKYKNLILLVYGLLALTFIFYVSSFVYEYQNRQSIIDISFLDKQVEKIKHDQEDFKFADIPYIEMICQERKEDFFVREACKTVKKFIDSK